MTARHIHHRLMGAGLVAFLVLVCASVAVAQIPDGRLQVDGAGTVSADGQLVVIGAASAKRGATLRVTDRAGNAQVTVNGQVQAAKGGKYNIRQNGRFLVSGTGISLEVNGDSVSLSVAGSGMARLRGSGTYSVNGAAPASWNQKVLYLGAAAAPVARVSGKKAKLASTRGAQR